MNLIILIIGVGVVLGVLNFFISKWSVQDILKDSARKRGFGSRTSEEMDEIRGEASEALAERTEKRKEKILYLMGGEDVHQEELKACGIDDIKKGLTSHDVEKLLDVSNGTALKYLNELEKEGKVVQVGKTGRDVYYTLNKNKVINK